MPRTGWAAIGAVLGSLLAGAFSDARLIWLAAAAGAFVVLASRWAPAAHRVAVAATAAGACLIFCRAAAGGLIGPVPQAPAAEEAFQTTHTGVVLSVGTPSGGQQRAVVELRPPESAVTAYVWLPRYPQVVPEDVIAFDGRLEQPPAEGDFADYLARSGIDFTDKARTLSLLGADDSPLAGLETVRRTANDLIDRVLPEPQAGLATAMAIGLRDVVARDVSDDFRTSGLSHVVAISGWHIAMLGAVVAALLGGVPRRQRSVVVVLAIGAYSILAGAAPSILRAALMAAAVIVARESGRRGQANAALAITCIGLLVVDPATVSDVGFELSAIATAGLLAWAKPLHEWLVRRLPARAPGWFVEALSVSLAAQAATLPLILVQFGRLSLVAPLANLLIAPLVAPAMLITAICLVAGATLALGLPMLATAPVTLIGALVVGAMIEIARFCAALPYASIDLPPPFNLVGALVSGAAIFFVVRRSGQGKGATKSGLKPASPKPQRAAPRISRALVAAATAALVLVFLLAVVVLARPDGRLHVSVLDIGQGDSILIEGPAGGRMLIDAGPDPDLELQRLDARIPAWDRRIEVVVLTHPHEDHVGGLALLLERYRIGKVIESGSVGRGPGDAAYRRVLVEQDRQTSVVAAGDRLSLDGIEFDVEWPPAGSVPPRASDDGKQVNNGSIVMDLRYGSRRMLFTGDMEEDVDPQLIARGLAQHLGGPIDVLKVAHHGSGTATTDELLDVLNPKVAVISVGAGNNYGHPSPATLARLTRHGATVYRTDLDGSVEITTDGRDLTVTAERRREPPGSTDASSVIRDRLAVSRWRPRTYNRPRVRSQPRASRNSPSRTASQREAIASLVGRRGNRRFPRRCHGPPGSPDRRDGR